jgi:hypothetical protein
VPADAVAFVHVRLAELWNSTALADLRGLLVKAGPKALQTFEHKYAPAPSTLECLTVIYLTPESFDTTFENAKPKAVSPLLVATTSKPYNAGELRKAFGADARARKYKGQEFFSFESSRTGLQLLDERTFVYGSEAALQQWLARSEKSPLNGPLAAALQEASQKHHVVLGVSPAALPKKAFGPFRQNQTTAYKISGGAASGGGSTQSTFKAEKVQPAPEPWPEFVKPLLSARCATFTLDLDKALHTSLKLDFATETQASDGRKGLRASLDAAVTALDALIAMEERRLRDGPRFTFTTIGGKAKEQPKGPNALPRAMDRVSEDVFTLVQLGACRGIKEHLQALVVEQKDRTVRVESQLPMGANTLIATICAVTALGQNANSTFTEVGTTIGSTPPNGK